MVWIWTLDLSPVGMVWAMPPWMMDGPLLIFKIRFSLHPQNIRESELAFIKMWWGMDELSVSLSLIFRQKRNDKFTGIHVELSFTPIMRNIY